MNRHNKLEGYIYGSALGDALGAPVEFSDLQAIRRRYGSKGIQKPPKHAVWTDDTEMMIAVARGVSKVAEKELDTIMGSVVTEYIAWLDNPGLAPGNTCLRSVYRLKSGASWQEAGDTWSKGCGSAMRSGIIGFIYQYKPEKLKEIASATGKATHAHPTADAACIAAAYLVKLALDGVPPSDFPDQVLDFTRGISDEFEKKILQAETLAKEDITSEEAMSQLGRGWVGEEAVAMALYAVLKAKDSYKNTVRLAVNVTGDSDSVGCIAGGIAGARLGIDAIPGEWVNQLVEKDRLAKITELVWKRTC